jgi:hypothetical protein
MKESQQDKISGAEKAKPIKIARAERNPRENRKIVHRVAFEARLPGLDELHSKDKHRPDTERYP